MRALLVRALIYLARKIARASAEMVLEEAAARLGKVLSEERAERES